MSVTKLSARQTILYSTLSRIFPGASDKELDDILRAVDEGTIQPFEVSASSPADLTVSIGASTVTNSENNYSKSGGYAGKVMPVLSSGSIIFPSVDSGAISVTPGDNITLNCPSGNYQKILIYINGLSEIGLLQGTPDASASNVSVPAPPSNSLPIAWIQLYNDAGTIDNISQDAIYMFTGGAGGSSAALSGIGSDLGDLEFRASFEDSFVDTDLVNEATASHSPSNESYTIEYDATLTSPSGTTGITWSGTPNFSVQVGDVVIAEISGNKEVRRIISVANQNTVTVEDAFSANVSTATSFVVSQMVETVDMVHWYDSVDAESFSIGEMVGHIALTNVDNGASDTVNHSESPDWLTPQVGDVVLKNDNESEITSVTDSSTFVLDDSTGFSGDGDAVIIRPLSSFAINYIDDGGVGDINVAAQVMSNTDTGGNWGDEYAVTRKQNFQDTIDENTISGTSGAHMRARFFANKTSGEGSVDLYQYSLYFYKESDQGNGGIINQSIGRLDGSDTPVNCNISVVGGKTRIYMADDFPSFVSGLNPGLAFGDLIVHIDGKEIPRYINSSTTVGSYYTEDPSGLYIELDDDYSSYNWMVTVTRRQGNIDSSNSNSTEITKIKSFLTGMLYPFAGVSADVPDDALECDGSTIGKTGSGANYEGDIYEGLFNIIKKSWGNSGSEDFSSGDTVKLPDLRGVFLRGSGEHGTETMANGSAFTGPSVGSFENDQIQGHFHNYRALDSQGNGNNNTLTHGGLGDEKFEVPQNLSDYNSMVSDGNGTPRDGAETRPFNVGVLYIIKI